MVYSGRRRKEALAFLNLAEPFTTQVGRIRTLAEDLRENMVFVTVKERGTPSVQARDAADIIKSMIEETPEDRITPSNLVALFEPTHACSCVNYADTANFWEGAFNTEP